MNILITNDDGFKAPGLWILAEAAREFGDVKVIAPAEQSSAMAHHVTFHRDLCFLKAEAPEGFDGEAYTLDGTPADCVRAAFLGLLPELPDVVFTGINRGANVGWDVLYSATVCAGMEALLYDAPAICFSQSLVYEGNDPARSVEPDFELARRFLPSVIEDLLPKKAPPHCLWNVNFPACPADECRGILYERTISQQTLIDDIYRTDPATGRVWLESTVRTDAEEGTDMRAVFDRYISVGIAGNAAMGAAASPDMKD